MKVIKSFRPLVFNAYMPNVTAWSISILLLSLSGCSGDTSTNGTGELIFAIATGNGQEIAKGDTSQPMSVLLTSPDGEPVSRRVDFALVQGSGILTQSSVVTDDGGQASVRLIAANINEPVRISATVFSTTYTLEFEVIVNGHSVYCKNFAQESWDPLDYIVWRGSRNARHSSITHALPCSSYVDVYLETSELTGCDNAEIQDYYTFIGKYDQFVAGWGDLVRVDTENRVEPTAVDSVQNFFSSNREIYKDSCK